MAATCQSIGRAPSECQLLAQPARLGQGWREPRICNLPNSSRAVDNDRSNDSEPHHVSEGTILFDQAEKMSIFIGWRDPLSRFNDSSPLGRFCSSLFGNRGFNALANPRLEALRQLVLALRQSRPEAEEKIIAALSSGVSQAQIDALIMNRCEHDNVLETSHG